MLQKCQISTSRPGTASNAAVVPAQIAATGPRWDSCQNPSRTAAEILQFIGSLAATLIIYRTSTIPTGVGFQHQQYDLVNKNLCVLHLSLWTSLTRKNPSKMSSAYFENRFRVNLHILQLLVNPATKHAALRASHTPAHLVDPKCSS